MSLVGEFWDAITAESIGLLIETSGPYWLQIWRAEPSFEKGFLGAATRLIQPFFHRLNRDFVNDGRELHFDVQECIGSEALSGPFFGAEHGNCRRGGFKDSCGLHSHRVRDAFDPAQR